MRRIATDGDGGTAKRKPRSYSKKRSLLLLLLLFLSLFLLSALLAKTFLHDFVKSFFSTLSYLSDVLFVYLACLQKRSQPLLSHKHNGTQNGSGKKMKPLTFPCQSCDDTKKRGDQNPVQNKKGDVVVVDDGRSLYSC